MTTDFATSAEVWAACTSRLAPNGCEQPLFRAAKHRLVCGPCAAACCGGGSAPAPLWSPATECSCGPDCLLSGVPHRLHPLQRTFLRRQLAAQRAPAPEGAGTAPPALHRSITATLAQAADHYDAATLAFVRRTVPDHAERLALGHSGQRHGEENLLEKGPSRAHEDADEAGDAPLWTLLRWFKARMTFVKKMPCSVCGERSAMQAVGARQPDAFERAVSGAGRCEVWRCGNAACNGATTDFPRRNKVQAILAENWSMGRCGEWANAFCACCVAEGLDARMVLDLTDHVWVEVWSASRRRWMQCDPCEVGFDAPLLYEAGWGKRLTFVIALSPRFGVVDVSRRYTASWPAMLFRRARDGADEAALWRWVANLNAKVLGALPRDQLEAQVARQALDEDELSRRIIRVRKKNAEDLQRISGAKDD